MHDIEFRNTTTKHSEHTIKRLAAPLKKNTTYPKQPVQYFDYENNIKLQRMTTQIARNRILTICLC